MSFSRVRTGENFQNTTTNVFDVSPRYSILAISITNTSSIASHVFKYSMIYTTLWCSPNISKLNQFKLIKQQKLYTTNQFLPFYLFWKLFSSRDPHEGKSSIPKSHKSLGVFCCKIGCFGLKLFVLALN